MPGSKEEDFKEMMQFHYVYHSYCHALVQEPPILGVMKLTILVNPSLVIISIYGAQFV